MKVCINGKYIEKEETAEELKIKAEKREELSLLPPTETERLEALEQAFMEFVEVMVNG